MASAPSDLNDFVTDPVEYFDRSITQFWTMPDADRETYQLAGLKLRFSQLRDSIAYLKKLADRDQIDEIKELNDVVPLLFPHTVYKSYPSSLLEKQKFSTINSWLGKLTTHKVDHVDVSGCDSIDSWLDAMDAETELLIHTSSGTTGTLSLFPKSKFEAQLFGKFCTLRFQTFGDPRPADPAPKAHVIVPTFRFGGSAHFRAFDEYSKQVAKGDPDFVHVALPGRMSADIMYLAGRVRAAKARGDLDRLEVPEAVLARLSEFEAGAAVREEQMQEFLTEVTDTLAGERVWLACASSYIWPMAERGLAAGKRGVFASDSMISTGGGAKGLVLPPDWKQKVCEFTGKKTLTVSYGMTEVCGLHTSCERGNYHIMPTVIPFVLDPDTGKPYPRTGTVTGRFAVYDLIPDSHWGGFITGDEVTVTFDKPCGCGRTGPYVGETIGRYSEQQGGDDKISCAASSAAHEEAMDFLLQRQSAPSV